MAKEQPAESSRAAQPALPRVSQPILSARKGLAPGETLTEEDRGFVVDDEEGTVDGTSCASPIFASVVALINDALIEAGKSPLG